MIKYILWWINDAFKVTSDLPCSGENLFDKESYLQSIVLYIG